jgi:hypothetical protein
MLKKLGLSMLFVAATISTNTYAATKDNILQAGATLEYELVPNQPQLFTNYMMWAIEAKCKITSEDEGNVLFAKAIRKSGKLNDIPWTTGESLRVTVHNGEILKINADKAAQVEITNEGQHTVRATCTSN